MRSGLLADRSPIQEDFRALAAEAAAVALEPCDACQTHHMLWPLNRVTRVVSAVEGGRDVVSGALARYAADGRKRILIAGCSDTGVLCLAANAVREQRSAQPRKILSFFKAVH